MLRISFARHKCIGCNACVEAAPERWRVSGKDGRCTLIEGREGPAGFEALVCADEYAQNAMAAANCPVKIIRLQLNPKATQGPGSTGATSSSKHPGS